MARKIYEESKIAEIAKRIREKTGGATTYTTAEMADGVAEVYEAGKKAEYDAFWDAYQENGNRTNYHNAFSGNGWTKDTYKPKYAIKPTYAYGIFANSRVLQGRLEFDFSLCTDFRSAFSQCFFEHIGVIDASSATQIDSAFYRMYYCHTIDKLIMHERVTSAGTAFNLSSALVNITIEGVIACAIDIHWSPLSYDSIVSIISHLSDTATGQTLTLSKVAVDKAFATGRATYQFNDDDTELLKFLQATNLNIYDVNFESDGESFVSLIANDPNTMLYSIDVDATITAYQNGWANEAYKTITVADSSTIPVDFMSHLIKMAKRASHVSTLENGSASPEWLAFVASKPNWTITLV